MTERPNPIEQAVETVVYAPLGLALEARRLLPTFVERGRSQVDMLRMVGQFAVRTGTQTANRRAGQAQEQIESFLESFGLVSSPSEPVEVPAAANGTRPRPSAPRPAATTGRASTADPSQPAVDLPISDYDSLAASQVIPLLTGLEQAELEAVRDYEATHRGRKTILGRVAQLQGS